MSDEICHICELPISGPGAAICSAAHGQAHSPAPAGSPAPSWDDFCARMKQCAPALMPDETDAQWQNLYGVYQLGYSSALEAVMKTLEQENVRVSGGTNDL